MFSSTGTKFNFDFIFTLTKLLYYKILQTLNIFDNTTRWPNKNASI